MGKGGPVTRKSTRKIEPSQIPASADTILTIDVANRPAAAQAGKASHKAEELSMTETAPRGKHASGEGRMRAKSTGGPNVVRKPRNLSISPSN
jgi:hypothetical protein